MVATLGACISFHLVFVFNKISWIHYISLQVLFLWKKIHVNPSSFECLGAIQSLKSGHIRENLRGPKARFRPVPVIVPPIVKERPAVRNYF